MICGDYTEIYIEGMIFDDVIKFAEYSLNHIIYLLHIILIFNEKYTIIITSKYKLIHQTICHYHYFT